MVVSVSGRVETALEADLASLPENLALGALAASALAMAREIDSSGNSATSKSMCQARLQDALAELRSLAPPEVKRDAIDEIKAAREKRLRLADTKPVVGTEVPDDSAPRRGARRKPRRD